MAVSKPNLKSCFGPSMYVNFLIYLIFSTHKKLIDFFLLTYQKRKDSGLNCCQSFCLFCDAEICIDKKDNFY